jgi:hypothetical protein
MAKTSGAPGTDFEVLDLSILINSGLKGINAVVGITERGHQTLLIGSIEDYRKHYGGLMEDTSNLFPLLIRRGLEAGGKFWVHPVQHYLDKENANTLVGTKATKSNTLAIQAAVAATGDITITTPGTDGETWKVFAGGVEIGSYVQQAADTPTLVAAGLLADINGNTGTTGYSAAAALGVLTVTAPVADGSDANDYSLIAYNSDGTGVSSSTGFSGGIDAAAAQDSVFTAKSVGAWANNKLWYSVAKAANGVADEFDVTFGLDGYPELTVVVKNQPKTPAAGDLAKLNDKIKDFVEVTSFTGDWRAVAKTYLAGGVRNEALITSSDHIGSSVTGIGINAFDEVSECTKIACPGLADPVVDAALVAYAASRKDMLAVVRTPVGAKDQGILDYREGTGAYSHQAIDDYHGLMFTGGLKVLHPVTELEVEIPEIGDVLGAMSVKDNSFVEWLSFGGQKRGRIKNTLGVVVNYGAPGRKTWADLVSERGVNAVIDHPSFGTVIWDNRTLQKANTLLRHANVAELLVYIKRVVTPLVETENFDPNDVDTWKAIYRRVQPILQFIKDNRGVWDYLYQGDQDVEDVSQAVVNTPAAIDAGSYQFNIFLQPKVAMKYQGIRAIVTNSGVDFEELSQTAV